ncbi:unnamed protein product, partial [Cuscuta epithymum]
MNLDPINSIKDEESDGKSLWEKETGDDSSWPHFEEEDYIVFCFSEDGEIHAMEDRKSEPSNNLPSANKKLRHVSRKLKYEENEEKNYSGSYKDIVLSFEKGEESGSGDTDAELEGDEGTKGTICPREEEGILEPSGSSAYDHPSNASRGSFAFP